MPTISPIALSATDSNTSQTLIAVKSKIGMIPNLFLTLANSPAALHGYLRLSESLGSGFLNTRQREIVALVVAQENGCQYCLSAHTAISKGAGLSDAEILSARFGTGAASKSNAIVSFSRKVVQKRGHLSAEDLEEVRRAGIDDGTVIEIIANVALNILTNYTNNLANTDVDFPLVEVEL
ncbi:MAG: alkylhydroperoxidase [Methylotenera sp.]|jgi:uncharacterized peroxidase-related enzyme|uniref:carboxymuconolactone decarboxylase family protein n=1 Tax=Methylotenera TaxID=359407 RepID=UPI000365E4EC|nr:MULTISPECIES: carboxymuconolactone decarboxylase family protein [Methylotenera]MDP3777577.1 carboxymuconolactone decarboxylase family protein [Methylotenera sp.]PPC96342.1 MAG: alkylhydroperoxidase [Methylotenera sp.]PPD00005.1 MAG: alkylhydroperoxidase [Methylotenera sp.]